MPEQHEEPAGDPESRVRARVRQLRQARGWAIGELARRSGIDASTVSRLETGHRRLSLRHLAAVAAALDATIDELLADEAEPEAAVLEPIPMQVDGMRGWALSPTVPAEGREVVKLRVEADRPTSDPRTHPGREWVYVLAGVLALRLGERVVHVPAGRTVEFATTVPHALSAVGGPAELLVIYDSYARQAHLPR